MSGSTLTVSELMGPARRLYDDWRELGKTEAEALEEVRRSGIVEALRSKGGQVQEKVSDEHLDALEEAIWGPRRTAYLTDDTTS